MRMDCTTLADGLSAYGDEWFEKIVIVYNSRDPLRQHLADVVASRQSAAFFARNREAGGAIENGLPNACRWAAGIRWRMV